MSAQKEVPPASFELMKDFIKWWGYHTTHIILSADFTALNTAAEKISKGAFLDSLSTGDYIPYAVSGEEMNINYQLVHLTAEADKDIRTTMLNIGKNSNQHFKMEGLKMPAFEWTDLNGQKITNSSIAGKILVIKCWFVHCVPCVAEIPALNKLVKSYMNRKNIQFVSLAIDSKEKINQFLSAIPFQYAVVPDQEAFMTQKLSVGSYPTHLIIGRDGCIFKVVNSAVEMKGYLNDIVSK